MKKIELILLLNLLFFAQAIAQNDAEKDYTSIKGNLVADAAANQDQDMDSLNIPVILVDGVEVQSVDSVDKEDIIDVKVIKDKNITKYFYPRVGGLMCITTKSKKYLTPIIERHKRNCEAFNKKKKEGEIYIK